ncbi:MAG: hydrogenase large subunit [Acidiferrobacteraceae bacterium]
MNGAGIQNLRPEALSDACVRVLREGGRMQMAYAWFPDAEATELRYVADNGGGRPFEIWRVPPGEATPSLASISPLLGWYEREMMDLCGVRFSGHPEPYPLVLHEGARPSAPPLSPAYPRNEPMPFEPEPRRLPPVQGEDVQQLPFGPIRGDVQESAQFTFIYIGEGILHYDARLFFKHRGMEKRFEGVSVLHGTLLAERVSGVGSLAHALAFCQAVESACDCEPPPRAQWLRVLLAELERVYNHLHYLGHLCHTTTLKVGEAEGNFLEERVKQINARISGSRFLRGVLVPGGLWRDLAPGWLGEELEGLRREIHDYTRRLLMTNSHLDRLITTGVLARQTAFDQGATGPVERASGLDRDTRRDHPYAAYAQLPVTVAIREDGDAQARMEVRIEEIDIALAMIQRVLVRLPEGSVRSACTPRQAAEGLGWAESARGTVFYAVHLGRDGAIARVKVKSPSFSNWRVFPYTVHDSNMMDYAINEASFGLTVSGCDR